MVRADLFDREAALADDDNYTIEDDDEPVAAAGVDDDSADRDPPSFRTWAPPGLIVLGAIVILLSAWAGTAQVGGFTERGPSKTNFFFSSLALPLAIVGALLVVSGILAFVLRKWNANPYLPEDVPLPDADG